MIGLVLGFVLTVVYKTDPVPDLMKFIFSEEAACKTEGVVGRRIVASLGEGWLLSGKDRGN